MKRLFIVLVLGLGAGGCVGMTTPGAPDPLTGVPGPSPLQVGLKATAAAYDESPWADFGPYGAGIAGIAAILGGLKAGNVVRKRRLAKREVS